MFGRGRYQQMTYADFLDKLDAGDTSMYLTTQQLEEDKDGPTAMDVDEDGWVARDEFIAEVVYDQTVYEIFSEKYFSTRL